ncbi:hypothetical protein QAD02_001461 [Eretmocerus hayati]|uniref:Uncharacterized protein n=1 Tax=Eretmocerus hayati TaxID=131215 RepID=A0ACC2NGJ2_9HYME|nr:hypothetical protein QAD02_001461 [Eretmocerus hayati]
MSFVKELQFALANRASRKKVEDVSPSRREEKSSKPLLDDPYEKIAKLEALVESLRRENDSLRRRCSCTNDVAVNKSKAIRKTDAQQQKCEKDIEDDFESLLRQINETLEELNQ